jgi:inositol phosphorylceramide synthase catalytic subunit
VILELINKKQYQFTDTHTKIIVFYTLFYVMWCTFVIDFRIDHLYFHLLIVTCFLLHASTRKFVLSFLFFIIFWILYDGLRVYPNYMLNSVHIIEPYIFEKSLFGINAGNQILTPNEFFNQNSNRLLDILTAVFYLTWVPIPFALALYLFATNKKRMLQFTSAYLFTNLVGFVIYYSYPAAPPWYFSKYGNVVKFDVAANAAGLLNFDKILGYPLFENLYTKNSNVFAAIPSLHAAYPIVTWHFSKNSVPSWFKWLIFIDIIGIWFSAVYTFHHYFIDVLIGGLVAAVSILIFEKFILKSNFSNFISNFAKFIETNKYQV